MRDFHNFADFKTFCMTVGGRVSPKKKIKENNSFFNEIKQDNPILILEKDQ